MNKTLKTSAVLLTLTLALSTAAAAAGSTNTSLQSQAGAVKTDRLLTVDVNGSKLFEKGLQPSGAKEPLVPLRAISEALGFEIMWNSQAKTAELKKGNIFTSVKSGVDLYVVNKMYTSLGTASLIMGDKIYVPASFVSKVLHQSIVVDGLKILISSPVESVNIKGVVTSVTYDERYSSIQLGGTGKEGIVLNVSKETVILSADGTPFKFSDLQIGMIVEVEHAIFSTKSLPPQSPAYKITVYDKKEQSEVFGTQGSVENLTEKEDGTFSIRIKGVAMSSMSQNEIVLRIKDNTLIVDATGEAIPITALAPGSMVMGFYNPTMAESLPPIGIALKIVLKSSLN